MTTGLLTKAGQAKEEAEKAGEKDVIQISAMQAMSNSKTYSLEQYKLQEALDQNVGVNKTTVVNVSTNFIIVFEESKRSYTIDYNGSIIGSDEINESPSKTFLAQLSDNTRGTETNPYEINCIEDLLDLSYKVNGIIVGEDGTLNYNGSGFGSNGKYFKLMRDLDFNCISSYENATRKDYGNINGDSTVGELINELTTGTGWICIGTRTYFAFGRQF